MKKNILICLEQLDIGGVETFVYNQVLSFLDKKYSVSILAKKGIYSTKLKKLGVKLYEFDYALDNKYDWNKIEIVSELIKDNKITEVHIHQYPCIPYVMPAVINNNIPYVAYVHSIVKGTFEWFINHYEIYKDLFSLYFNNANKIITITKSVQLEVSDFFGIPKKNILVINNCLHFDKLTSANSSNNKNKIILVSRLSLEKKQSILNGIKLFEKYAKTNNKATLTILGDGTIRKEIENHVSKSTFNNAIKFLGAVNNVSDYMNECDIVIGVDRCILEAIAYKKVSIISGYNNLKGIVTNNNIKLALEENFSGNNLDEVSSQNILNQLQNIDINKVTEYNYKYIVNKLDINNQDFTAIIKKNNYENLDLFFEIHSKFLDKYNESIRLDKEKYDIGQEKLELQKNISNLINDSEELKVIKNSRSWKMANKIKKILKR